MGKKQKIEDNCKSRTWRAILYDDDPAMVSAMEYIRQNFDYAEILHDKDTYDTGELKKPHRHFVLRFESPKWLSALCAETGLKPNYFRVSDNYIKSLQYLIHVNDKTEKKFRYPIDDVSGELKLVLQKSLNKTEDEEVNITTIIDLIYSTDDFLSVTDLTREVCVRGLYSYYRRSYAIVKSILDEHNAHCSQ